MKTAPINKDLLISYLSGSMFEGNVMVSQTVDSTNRALKRLASEGAPHGTVLVTEEQTAGRGRLDRKWTSSPGTNLLFSVLLRPEMKADQVFVLTMIMALAAVDGVKQACSLSARIKWPNDIYVDNRKLAGILTEFSVKNKKIVYVITGLGLNVNWCPEDRQGMRYPCTSILKRIGIKTDRTELLASILQNLDADYKKFFFEKKEALYKRWNSLSCITGKQVVINSNEQAIEGEVLKIDIDGSLIIKTSDNQEQKILCGDLSLSLV